MNTLLLVIDMQNVYLKGEKWECEDIEKTTANITRLIENGTCDTVAFTLFRADKDPRGDWGKYNIENRDVNESVYLNDMIPEIGRLSARGQVYRKSGYSALSNEELKEAVSGFDTVVLTGVVAECCVLSTAFSLIDMGIHVVWVTDAVSGISGAMKAAAQAALSGLSPTQVEFVSANELITA